MNAQQIILKFLSELSSETFTIETIARQTNLGYHTARRALTELRNVEYVQVTKGNWSITEVGKFEQERNPNFSLKFQLKPAANGRENWAELLGPETIHSTLGRFILQQTPKEMLVALLPYTRFFALCWLLGEGFVIDYNSLEETIQPTEITTRVLDILQGLAQEIQS